ncbi:MAG: AAA family ATPase [Phycisphaerales bacterium]
MSNRRVTRLALRQFKSIESCEIEFQPLTVLVGRNGVGKSNILDALRFITDSLQSTLEHAIRERGGIDQVRRKSLGGRPTNPGIAVRVAIPDGTAEYSFRIAAMPNRGFRVDRERCIVRDKDDSIRADFNLRNGEFRWNLKHAAPAITPDRLMLIALSGMEEFRPVYDVLTRMTFHNLNPEVMKYPGRPEPGDRLAGDGHNIASVIKRLQHSAPSELERVVAYLQALGIPIKKVLHKHAGVLETVEVAQEVETQTGPKNSLFDAVSLSDGTIRALGILISLVSARSEDKAGPSLIGIEEPETALHPAAVGALVDALIEGSESTQILLTCHSPDMLDHESITEGMIRIVMLDNGRTVVGPLSPGKAKLMQEHLVTAGELLRLDQLTPDATEIERQRDAKGTLFEALNT